MGSKYNNVAFIPRGDEDAQTLQDGYAQGYPSQEFLNESGSDIAATRFVTTDNTAVTRGRGRSIALAPTAAVDALLGYTREVIPDGDAGEVVMLEAGMIIVDAPVEAGTAANDILTGSSATAGFLEEISASGGTGVGATFLALEAESGGTATVRVL